MTSKGDKGTIPLSCCKALRSNELYILQTSFRNYILERLYLSDFF